VIKAGPKFKKLAQNRLMGRAQASMAISGRALYIRTDHFLYRIDRGAGVAGRL
jgi:hypothetical protein